MSRSRGFCFTINNPNVFDDLELEHIKTLNPVYLIWGRETGENGTPHYQGYVRFQNARSFNSIKALLSRAHLEIQRGTAQEAAEYCKKDGDYTEFGELPQSGAQSTKHKWREVIKLAEEGQIQTIKEEHPGVYFLHHAKLLSLRRRQPEMLEVLTNEWWWGPTGTGKSRRLWSEYPFHYPKNLTKWWDGYDDEEVVAIEEFTPESANFIAHYLKIWSDRYPFSPEIKGSVIKKIRPKKIIVLSNYSPEECFTKDQDLQPIKRRFKVVKFNSL